MFLLCWKHKTFIAVAPHQTINVVLWKVQTPQGVQYAMSRMVIKSAVQYEI